jgi:hypothetical protein
VAAKEAERVEELRGEWRAGGLAVAGTKKVLEAVTNGQADEVWLSTTEGEADEIVQRALGTSASVRFAENPELLRDMEGVAASLRYKPEVAPRDNSGVERKVEA